MWRRLEYYKSRIFRLQQLHEQMVEFSKKYGIAEQLRMQKGLAKQYQNSYYLDAYSKYRATGQLDIKLNHFNEQQLENIVYRPWKGSDFSKRIWKEYTEVLPDELTDALLRGTLFGYSPSKVVRMMRDRFQKVSERDLHRLVITEMGHAAEEATAQFYKDSDIEQYQYLATLESHTCDQCAHLDERIFNVKDKKERINYPLIHPYCRCTTVPYDKDLPDIETRWSRDPKTGKGTYVYRNALSYRDWKKINNIKIFSLNMLPSLNGPRKNKFVPKTLKHIHDVSISDYIEQRWAERPTSMPPTAETRKTVKNNITKQLNKIAELSSLPTVDVRMRVKAENLESILNNGFKNQFETNTSGGTLNTSYRKEATEKLFNIPKKDVDKFKPSDFEKYGYLWDHRENEPIDNALNQYGDVIIVFKKDIKTKTTYFHGDSLGIKGSLNQSLNRAAKIGEPNPSYLRNLWRFDADDGSRMKQKVWDDPSRKLSKDYTSINQFIKNKAKDYTEAQIRGKLTVDSIDYLEIPKDKLTNSLVKKLKESNIKYRVRGDSND